MGPKSAPTPVGTRVFAYGCQTPSTIKVFGAGVYAGVHDRLDGSVGHKIVLDDGHVVWGSEVNWVHETWTRTVVAGRRQVKVPVLDTTLAV